MRGDLGRADFLSPPSLLGAEELNRQRLLDDWYGKLAQISAQIAGGRAVLKARQEHYNRALKEARSPSTPASTLYDLAERLDKAEAEFAANVRPVLEQLTAISEKLGAKAPDKVDRAIQRYAEEAFDIGISWLELIQNYRIECLKLASEKGSIHPTISSAAELEREFSSILENED